jgi:hypothetical protein
VTQGNRHGRFPRLAASLTAAVVVLCQLTVHTQGISDEYRLKAAFVYRFPQFVEWPPAALASSTTLDLCVLRPDPFGATLMELVQGESLAGRPFRVRDITLADGLDGCHAVFASRDENGRAVLAAAAGHPILTIGETDAFLQAGGIIALKVVDRRVRFEVNATNAQRAGLRIDAQLLSLAASVRGGGR